MPDSGLTDNVSFYTSTFHDTYVRQQVITTCTSATRPTGVEGRYIHETDTNLMYCHDGSSWEQVGGVGGWTSFTTAISQVGTPAFTTNYSKWTRGPRRTIFWTFALTLTAAGTAGTKVTINLPVAASSSVIPLGTGSILDSGSQSYAGIWRAASTSTAQFESDANGLTGWGASPNLALASGDVLYGVLMYEAAT